METLTCAIARHAAQTAGTIDPIGLVQHGGIGNKEVDGTKTEI